MILATASAEAFQKRRESRLLNVGLFYKTQFIGPWVKPANPDPIRHRPILSRRLPARWWRPIFTRSSSGRSWWAGTAHSGAIL